METKNLMLRETEFEDCVYFAKWEVDPEITKFLSYDEDRTYEDVVRENLLFDLDETKLQYTIVKKSINKPIGRILISRIDRQADSLDITKFYIAGEENRRQGYGEEILRELLEYCFVFLHMERVTLDHYTGNKGASALYEKLGFEHEGIARNACKKDGKYYDLHLMSILRTEFFEKIHDR